MSFAQPKERALEDDPGAFKAVMSPRVRVPTYSRAFSLMLLLMRSDAAAFSVRWTHCVVQSAKKLTMFLLAQVLWCVLFSTMIVVAACGNLIVIWIVLAHKRMRTVTNYFIVNLSIADTMVSTLNVIFNFTYMLRREWWFGEWYCKFSNFIAVVSVSASVFTLMAISIDRWVYFIIPLYLSAFRPALSLPLADSGEAYAASEN